MNFEYSARSRELQDRMAAFMGAHVYPNEHVFAEQLDTIARYRTPPIVKVLQEKARREGLWNLFLSGKHGAGLTILDYAPVAEIVGRVSWAAKVFNCTARDTGNMELLSQYGSDEQKKRWLEPLLAAKIRSAFVMTEPEVASSDATNICCSIHREGDQYVINGRKWFASGAMNDECKVLVVMGKTSLENSDAHRQQSFILVPKDTQGVRIVRDMKVFGYEDGPLGHPEIVFENVRVPVLNMLAGEDRGFEIAQAFLGPVRIQQCLRLIGSAQRALELMCGRAQRRVAFGKRLGEHGSVGEDIANSWIEIEQARLLVLRAADQMDREGYKAARELIAAVKAIVPSMAARVIDRAIQIHGAMGVSQDTILAEAYMFARYMRIADGPDQVHLAQLGRTLQKKYAT